MPILASNSFLGGCHAGRCCERDQERRGPCRPDARCGRRICRPRPPGAGRDQAGAGIDADDDAYVAAGATIAKNAAEIFARADMIVKVKEPQPKEWAQLRPGPDPLHLSPSRRRRGADARADRFRRHRGRLRDGHRRPWRPAAACADERSRRTPFDPGGGDGAAEAEWRPRRAPRRRAGRARRARSWSSAAASSARKPRAWPSASAPRSPSSTGRCRASAPSTTSSPAASAPASRPARRSAEEVFSADAVIGAVLVPGAAAPKLVTRAMLAEHEAGRGARRRRHRPGRLLRDLARDHPCRADLRGRRHRPLLRRQHAGRGAAHLEPRAQQRDAALRPGARRSRPRGARPRTRISATASTSTTARSPTGPSPKASASPSPTPPN